MMEAAAPMMIVVDDEPPIVELVSWSRALRNRRNESVVKVVLALAVVAMSFGLLLSM
jgi:hypothetical protein